MAVAGQRAASNIDLLNRPKVRNAEEQIEVYDIPEQAVALNEAAAAGIEVYDIDAAAVRENDRQQQATKRLDASFLERGSAGGKRSYYSARAAMKAAAANGNAQIMRSTMYGIDAAASQSGLTRDQYLAQYPQAKAESDRVLHAYVNDLADALLFQQRAAAQPQSSASRALHGAGDVGEKEGVWAEMKAIGSAFAEDPHGLLFDLLAENSLQFGAQAVAIMAARGARLGRAGEMGAGYALSAFNEFGAEYTSLRSQGMEHDEAWAKAATKAGVVGAFDAASLGATGKAVDAMLKTTFMQKAKALLKGTAADATLGGGGEFWSQVAENRSFKRVPLSDIAAEIAGEFASSPVQIGAQAVGAAMDRVRAPVAGPGAPPPPPGPTPAEAPPAQPGAPAAAPAADLDAGAIVAEEIVNPADVLDANDADVTQPIEVVDLPAQPQHTAETAVSPEEARLRLVQMSMDLPSGTSYTPEQQAERDRLRAIIDESRSTKVDAQIEKADAPVIPSRDVEVTPGPADVPARDEPETPALPAPADAEPVDDSEAVDLDSRLQTPEAKDDLDDIRSQVGWDEVGGRLIRAPGIRSSESGETGGKVTGRTKWLGPQLWRERPSKGGRISEKDARAAIDKAARGEVLNTRERRFLTYALGHIDKQRAEQAEYESIVPEPVRATDEDYSAALLEPEDRYIGSLAEQARHMGVDPDEVDLALEATDDEKAIAKLKALIDTARGQASQEARPDQAPALPPRAEGETAAAAGQTDLLGADVGRQEALNAAGAKVDRKLGAGRKPVPPETGGGLFAAQTEKEDAAAAAAQSDIESAPQSRVDAAANQAATSPHNGLPAPTEGQADAGNYRKGHISAHGHRWSIENPAGSERPFKKPNGKVGSRTMRDHYGYLRGTEGADGDHIDVFFGPGFEADNPHVLAINQQDPSSGEFDEVKLMVGYADAATALAAYRRNYQKGWTGDESAVETDMAGVDSWLEGGRQRGKFPKGRGTPVTTGNERQRKPAEAPQGATDQFAGNKVFTSDAVAKARAILKAKLGQASSGIDPELVQAGITIAGAHLEAGARRWADFTRAMIEDLGEAVRPYLRSWYEALRWDPRAADFRDEMTDAAQITEEAAPAADPRTAAVDAMLDEMQEVLLEERGDAWLLNQGGDERTLIALAEARLRERGWEDFKIGKGDFLRNPEGTADVFIRSQGKYGPPILQFSFTGEPKPKTPEQRVLEMLRREEPVSKLALAKALPDLDAKQLEEAIELAIVLRAREIVAEGKAPQETYQRLVDLYAAQPTLSTRTSTSVEQQAYSTPAPLAYVASQLAGIGPDTTVLEPTAGNGMLLIAADPKKSTVNELNEARAAALRSQGFTVTQQDAVTFYPGAPVDVVIANPPFGAVRDGNGFKRFEAPLPDGKSFQTGEVDHAIVMRALRTMKPGGRAALIIGSVAKQLQGKARSDAYHGAAKRQFFWHLYQNFNVTDQFTVAGNLYAKQGASWPVDVIVIEGMGRSKLSLPAAAVPRVYDSWADLASVLTGERRGQASGVVANDEAAAGDAGVRADEQRDEAGSADVPERVERPSAGPDRTPGRPARGPEPSDRADVLGRPAERPGSDTAGVGGRTTGNEQPGAVGTTAGPRDRPAGQADRADGNAAGARADGHGQPGPGRSPGELAQSPDGRSLAEAAQLPYTPASTAGAIGTLVPTNMSEAISASLRNLESRVGNLDDYLTEALGYEPGTIGKYLAAEQVDGVAMALDQLSRGKALVLGDQTGTGKGRQVASVIRWALRQGFTPIFVTEKPDLYADMYRDLLDVGQTDIRPLMTNSGVKPIKLTSRDDGPSLSSAPAPKHNAILARVRDSLDLGEFNMVFTTYYQLQTVSGDRPIRMDMVAALAPNAIIIFDESHNAGGQDAARGRGGRKDDDHDGPHKIGRAAEARALVGASRGVLYSSATWAKRPSVMDLYFKTDMALAVDGDIRKLPAAIARGGVPLQQAVAAQLARAGQYIRREKSFAGIDYNTPVVPVDLRAAEALSGVMRAVKDFDDAKEAAVEAIKQDIKSEAKAISHDGSTGGAGAKSTNFTAIMHNLIDQMLLALKVDAAVELALQRHAAGEKVVLTVSNTMGSFIKEYASAAGLKPGDGIALSFKDLMLRYLERSRDIFIKNPDGSKIRRPMTDAELGHEGRRAFNQAKELIEQADSISSMPISPIDHMHRKLRAAGVRTGEITGRQEIIDYSGESPVYRMREKTEKGPGGKRNTILSFNSGLLDMLIINQSGSTGVSLHASEKFADKKPRRMIVVQAEKNIDIHMQVLGRINRTGQVVLPAYYQLTADIPAEKRPAAVLAKKMASLNANTTAARGSAVTSKDVVDFMNVYGDEVAAQLMDDMPELFKELAEPLDKADHGDGYERMDAARKVTGRIPLLPVAQQEEVYGMIEAGYAEALARAEAMGENALEARTFDLDAKTTERRVLFAGNGDSSPFSQGAFLETANIKRIGKPHTSAEVRAILADHLGIEIPEGTGLQEARRIAKQRSQEVHRDTFAEFAAYRSKEAAHLMLLDLKEAAKEGRLAALDALEARWSATHQMLNIGQSYRLLLTDGSLVYGVLTDVKRKKGVKLPVAMGSWQATFAIADASRTLTLPFSKIIAFNHMLPGAVKIAPTEISEFSRKAVFPTMFDDGQSAVREDRYIATGNLLAAFASLRGGQIINYTTRDGKVVQGIIMPRTFDIEEFAQSQPVDLSAEQVGAFFREAPQAIVETPDKRLSLRRSATDYFLHAPKSKAEGAEFFLDRGLTDIVGDFQSRGDKMIARFPGMDLLQVTRYLISRGHKLQTSAFTKEAMAVGGTRPLAQQQKPDKQAGAPPEGHLDISFDRTQRQDKVLPEAAAEAHLARILGPSSGIRGAIVDPASPPPEWAEYIGSLRKRGLLGRWRGSAVRDKNGRPVVLLAKGRFATLAELEAKAVHEAAHHGLDAMFGDRFTDYAVRVFNSQGRSTFADVIARYFPDGLPDTREAKARVVNEYIARLSETVAVDTMSARLRNLLDNFLSWLQNALRAAGWRTNFPRKDLRDIARESVATARAGNAAAQAEPDKEAGQALDQDDARLREAEASFVAKALRQGQYIDQVAQLVFARPFGRVVDGKFRPYGPIDAAVKAAAGKVRRAATGSFTWLRGYFERAEDSILGMAGSAAMNAGVRAYEEIRHGMGERIGTPKAFVEREQDALIEKRHAAQFALDIGKKLMTAVRDADEAKVLKALLEGEVVDDDTIKAVGTEVVDAIEDLGHQLVELGALSAEVFEKNRRKYATRSYLKHELHGRSPLMKWILETNEKMATGRRHKIGGKQFRARGLKYTVPIASLRAAAPAEWWGRRFEQASGSVDVALHNSRWRRLERVKSPTVAEQGEALEGTSGKKDRVLQVVYLPATGPVPKKFAGWKDGGIFDVVFQHGGHVTLRRDWTKQERTRMGEILDGRYVAIKTLANLGNDVATLRLYRDIAKNPEWATKDEPPAGTWVDAKEASFGGILKTYSGVEWVRVPSTKLPGAQVKRYGDMGGMWVKASIWRDLVQLEYMQLPSFWQSMMRVWKVAHTAYAPPVHMNNVASNFFLADLMDLRWRNIYAGARAIHDKSELYIEARNHNLFGNSNLQRDIDEQLLQPLLREMASVTEGDSPAGMMRGLSLLAAGLRKAGQLAKRAYEIEDEIFRMAAYAAFRERGLSPRRAASRARRQFIDYDIRAPWVNAARATAIPFIGYTYRAIPLLAEAVVSRPWKIAKYVVLGAAINALGYALTGDDDEDRERRLMDEQYHGMTWFGIPRMIRMPWNDANGNPVFLDIRRWVPAGDVFETNGTAMPSWLAWLQIGGPLLTAIEAAVNKNTFTNEDLFDEEEDSFAEAQVARAKHVGQSFLPNIPLIPGSYSFENLRGAVMGELDGAYQEQSVSMAALSSVGVKLRRQNTEYNAERKGMELNATLRKLGLEESSVVRQHERGKLSTEDAQEALADIEERVVEAERKFSEAVQ